MSNTDKQLLTTQSGKQVELTDQQADLLDLCLTTTWTKAQIAEHMGTNVTWVYQTLRKQHVIEAMNKAISESMTFAAAEAFSKVRELTQHKSGYVALEASKDILDRAGFKPVDRSQVAVGGDISINIDLGG